MKKTSLELKQKKNKETFERLEKMLIRAVGSAALHWSLHGTSDADEIQTVRKLYSAMDELTPLGEIERSRLYHWRNIYRLLQDRNEELR